MHNTATNHGKETTLKPVAGAFLTILGVLLLGWNVLVMLSGGAPAAFAFGAGGCALFVGYRWVKGESASTPG